MKKYSTVDTLQGFSTVQYSTVQHCIYPLGLYVQIAYIQIYNTYNTTLIYCTYCTVCVHYFQEHYVPSLYHSTWPFVQSICPDVSSVLVKYSVLYLPFCTPLKSVCKQSCHVHPMT